MFKRKDFRNKEYLYLTFFITNKCNLRCSHCFYNEYLNSNEEITAEAFYRITRTIKNRIGSIILTGGEPFLNPHLVEICYILSNKTSAFYIDLDTNGFTPDIIIKTLKKILLNIKIFLNLQVSLDGLQYTHDTIRNKKHSFDNAIKTIKYAKDLLDDYKNFSLCILTTINQKNYNELNELNKFVKSLNVAHHFTLIRGFPFGVGNLPQDIASSFCPASKNLHLPPINDIQNIYNQFFPIINNPTESYLKQRLKFKIMLDTLIKKQRCIKCYAGHIEAIVYPNLDVAICEFTKPVANLKDYNYNFRKLWNSKPMKKILEKTKNCYCIHSCNIIHALKYEKYTDNNN